MTDCRGKVGPSSAGGLTGWAFVWSSVGVFVVPLVFGVIGAVMASGTDTRRFLFGSAGLLLGMTVSAMSYKIFSHISTKKETDS